MKVIVDGIEDLVNVEEVDGETLLDFFDSFKEFVSQNAKVVTMITSDGYEITPPFVDDIFEKAVTEINELRIETISIKDLCLQTIDEVDKHIGLSVGEFRQASDIIYSQRYDEAVQLINRATQKWRFGQRALDSILTILLNRNITMDKDVIKRGYKEIEESIVTLSESLQNQDFMMVKDVIDYEILDRLEKSMSFKDELRSRIITEF